MRKSKMNPLYRWSLAVIIGAVTVGVARAESLRCEAGTVSEGDSRLSVLYKCGEPKMRDASCAPVIRSGTRQPAPEPFASGPVPCLQTEEWLYERGHGNLVATVHIRSGKVQSIKYGRVPR